MSGLRVRLLAAGQGKRAGGPKAWGPYDGKTLLEAQVGFLATVTAPENIDIAIQEEWLDRCRDLSPRVNWVTVDPEGEALASLQALLKATARARSFVIHVDMPVFRSARMAHAGRLPGRRGPGAQRPARSSRAADGGDLGCGRAAGPGDRSPR